MASSGSGGAGAAVATAAAHETLQARFPGRAPQIKTLGALLQGAGHAPQCLFVYGSGATGKTHVVREIMHELGLNHAWVNCLEGHAPRIIFEQILNALSKENSGTKARACDSLHEFVLRLNEALDDRDPVANSKTTYIVLDDADRLRKFPASVLAVFLRLAELVNAPVSVILISKIVWEKFRGGTGTIEPFLVHFPAYRKQDVLDIVAKDRPTGEDAQFFAQFVELLWGVFNGPCRDLNELRHLVGLLFPKYLEPVTKGLAGRDDGSTLYRHIAPQLKQQLSKLYLRETSTAEWSKSEAAVGKKMKVSGDMELPYLSKHLLVAAYLASYNPASTDITVFAKRSAGRRKKSRKTKKAEKVPQRLLGPKTFPLDRLLAIFYSIVESRVDASSEIYAQIASLVTLRLIAQVTGADNLDAPRFKCMVGLQDVQRVAASIEFPVANYIYEAGN